MSAPSSTEVLLGDPSRPPIVVVPPLGIAAGVLSPFTARLSRSFRVAVVELPGSGHAALAPPTVTTRELAGSLAATIRRLELERPWVFGASFGGMVAQWLAIDFPGEIGGLALCSTAARGLDAALTEPWRKLAALHRALVAPVEGTRAKLADAVVSPALRGDHEEIGRIEHELEKTPRPDRELAWLAAAVARHDARQHLGAIDVPTLVLCGQDDDVVPGALSEALAAAIPGATLLVVPSAGHGVSIDQPEAAAEAVEHFVLAHDSRAGAPISGAGRPPARTGA